MEKPRQQPHERQRYNEVYARAERFMGQLPENRERGLDNVYRNFFALTGIPRTSKHEAQVGDFLEIAGQERKYSVERDTAGNVLWRVPASSPEYATKEASVVLQTHQDMVSQGTPNPAEHGVEPEVFTRDGSWFIRAKDNQTTLGADDGIMLATAMELPALLDKQGIPHGELAILFTTDEEQGLNGAKALQFDLDRYGNYLNLDSEWDGEITIGSAAVGDTKIQLPINRVPLEPGKKVIQLGVAGLKGGHSGVTIGDGTRQNAIKLVSSVLEHMRESGIAANIVSLEATGPMNAIPDKALAAVAVNPDDAEALQQLIAAAQEGLATEKEGATITVTEATEQATMLDAASSQNLVSMLQELPHGVKLWEAHDPTLVKTSTNLATVKLAPDEEVANLTMMSRSSDNNELATIREVDIQQAAEAHGATVVHDEASPAWEPVPDSDLALLVNQTSEQLLGKSMKQTVTHGGLETSHVIHTYPHFQGHIVSIGANVNNAHEVMEETEGPSVEKITHLTMAVVGELANQGRKSPRRRTV